MKLILLTAGAFLSFNGAFMLTFSNFNLGVILTAAAGIFFLLWGIFYEKIKKASKAGIIKYIRLLVIVLISLEALLTAFIAAFGLSDNSPYNEDALIVLGAGIHGEKVSLPLAKRLDEAIMYHQKNPSALIVVSGGQGFQESITEACAMERYLLARGLDESKIIKEEKAASTSQNMRFSKEILDNCLPGGYRIAIITNGFHIYRAVSIAKAEGLGEVFHIHAGLKWFNIIPCYIRESLAVLAMWAKNFIRGCYKILCATNKLRLSTHPRTPSESQTTYLDSPMTIWK